MKQIKSMIVLLLLALPTQHASAVAYCALRDPVNTIYALFPEADGYRSSVKTVGRPAREQVVKRLPATLHFNELGRHTLYIALKEGKPIGLVHARSEADEWGITEYAWGISPEQTIRNVIIQRSRNPVIRKMPQENLANIARDKNVQMLKTSYEVALAKGDNTTANIKLAALKALIITESVWPEALLSLKGQTSNPLPGPGAEPIAQLYDAAAVAQLTSMGLQDSPVFDRPLLQAYWVKGGAQQPRQLIVRTPFDLDEHKRILWWTLATDGEVISVIDEATRKPDQQLGSVIGYAPLTMRDCSSLADLAALELAILTRLHASG